MHIYSSSHCTTLILIIWQNSELFEILRHQIVRIRKSEFDEMHSVCIHFRGVYFLESPPPLWKPFRNSRSKGYFFGDIYLNFWRESIEKDEKKLDFWCLNKNSMLLDSPRNWIIFHGIALCALVTGVVFLLLGRGHYSIDVFIAYWVTSRYSVPTKHEDLKTSK